MDNRTVEEKIITTVTEMFEQRGYKNITIESSSTVIGYDEKEQKICAFCRPVPKLGIAVVQEKIGNLQKMNCLHGIIVTQEKPAYKAKEGIKNAINLNMYLELFLASELLFNITKHEYVPQHSLAEENESQRVKKEYGKYLPYILNTDPICRFYDFPKGSVVKILRQNGVVFYRLVV